MRRMRRRTRLLWFLPAVALASCEANGPGEDEDPEQDGDAMDTTRKSAEETRELADALLADAEQALTEVFPGLTWVSDGEATSTTEDGTCVYRPASRRVDTYLGREKEDHPLIEEALTEALAAHGLPEPEPLTGGVGGWLTTSSRGNGLELEFRSKGYAELRVSARSDGPCTG